MKDSGLKIGNIAFRSPFVLAPLAGITDGAFRRLCYEQGAALTYTEMVSAKGMYYKSDNTEALLAITPEEGPVGVQIFGAEPEMLAFAAEHLKGRPNILIDINMGCPVPKVVKNGEGSALLKDPRLAKRCVKAVVEKSDQPVTVKIRTGFSDEAFNYRQFALDMEDSGAAALTVHGRTREQYYSGKADWEKIAEIKRALEIPVLGNGDLFTAQDAINMLSQTGCDGVMIARGALGNPWIFRETLALWEGKPVPPKPQIDEIREMILRHLNLVMADKGEYVAVREMRRHLGWYIKGIKGAAECRRAANAAASADEIAEWVSKLGRRQLGSR